MNLREHNGVFRIHQGDRMRVVRVKRQAPDARFAPGERIAELANLDGKYNGFAWVSESGKVRLWGKYRNNPIYRDLALTLSVEGELTFVEEKLTCKQCNREHQESEPCSK